MLPPQNTFTPLTPAPSQLEGQHTIPWTLPPPSNAGDSTKSVPTTMNAEEVAQTFDLSIPTLDRRVAQSKKAVQRGLKPTFPLPLPNRHEWKRMWSREEVLEFAGIQSGERPQTPYCVEDLMKIFKVKQRGTIYRWTKASRSGVGTIPMFPLPLDTGGGARSKMKWSRSEIDAFVAERQNDKQNK